MVIRAGIIGFSEGNGHPVSFSAIVNGYEPGPLRALGWEVIYDYLSCRDRADFGVDNLTITHAWSQDPALTEGLCTACRIPHPVTGPDQLLGQVDAVIIARDDAQSHWPLARPFLEQGLPVFIDKPLTLDPAQLQAFRPYLENGLLMSCSGMRYARELDTLRRDAATLADTLCCVRGTIVNGWDRYGIHLLDACLGLIPGQPVAVQPQGAGHDSLTVEMSSGVVLTVDALGAGRHPCTVEFVCRDATHSYRIVDNFTMFRRLLQHFVRMVTWGEPAVPAAETLTRIALLIAGDRALTERRRVEIHELL